MHAQEFCKFDGFDGLFCTEDGVHGGLLSILGTVAAAESVQSIWANSEMVMVPMFDMSNYRFVCWRPLLPTMYSVLAVITGELTKHVIGMGTAHHPGVRLLCATPRGRPDGGCLTNKQTRRSRG